MARRLFPGGTHPPAKKFSAGKPIEPFPVPELLSVPLSQHIGAPAASVVKPRDAVLKGQPIGEPGGFVSASIHSPVSGMVKRIVDQADVLGRVVKHVLIENDGEEKWAEGIVADGEEAGAYEELGGLSEEQLKSRIADAGIVGMGGATFPTHVKISPPPGKTIDTVILNGVECEPYLTCDDRLMLEKGLQVLRGFLLVKRILKAGRALVGIEANKPDAFRALSKIAEDEHMELDIRMLPVRYPQGAEKQLIKALTGREVPAGGLPLDVNVVVQNVGTCFAVYEACVFKKPLIERVVTVTGEGVKTPMNVLCRIGTPVRRLLEAAQLKEEANKVIFGGPMMGLAQADLDLPVTKGTSGVLVLTDAKAYKAGPCIRCGACVRGCPMRLVPSLISLAVEAEADDRYEELNVADCIECGVCTYVCPARRPIVHQVKQAKARLAERKKEGA